jgi:tetratricopeptide (TPR) repeat protein
MGKTRPPEKVKLSKRNKKLIQDKKKQQLSPQQLLERANDNFQTGQIAEALRDAYKAYNTIQSKVSLDRTPLLPALNLLGEINVELGDITAAVGYFKIAVEIDPDGQIPEEQGGGAEKFMWLAQLSEEGGLDSVHWFQKGADVWRRDIADLASRESSEEVEVLLDEKTAKLASALCAIAEIYMTDLSWDDAEAEAQCNKVMEEAVSVAPDSPETLQTLASVRISQLKKEEAKQYLSKSMTLWKDLPPEDPHVPAYPTRISLARLLMEAGMEQEAAEVLDRLVTEDDQSVEAWYLSGFCQQLIAEKIKNESSTGHAVADEIKEHLTRARVWLKKCLQLYQQLEYEDERLRDHAIELTESINSVLPPVEGEEETLDDGEDWEDEDGDEDEKMEGT